MKSEYITIDGVKIHYQTSGSGQSVLLLIHGAVGSTNDFALQMNDKLTNNESKEGLLDKDEFTLVAYDLPGFGRSDEELTNGLKTDPTIEYFEFCAQIGAQLMAELKYKTYSVAGWSDGARVACLLAIKHESRVNSLLLWGFVPLMDEQSTKAIAKTRDTSTWDPQIREFYSSIYGEQKFSDLWRKYVDFIVTTLELPNQQIDLRSKLSKIKCPTLILHGQQDPIVHYSTHIKPLEMQIYDSDIMQFKYLAHNIHQSAPEQFNQVITTFVTSVRA